MRCVSSQDYTISHEEVLLSMVTETIDDETAERIEVVILFQCKRVETKPEISVSAYVCVPMYTWEVPHNSEAITIAIDKQVSAIATFN